jgi:hypothetical protein
MNLYPFDALQDNHLFVFTSLYSSYRAGTRLE